MKLPIIKHLVRFGAERDVDFLHETLETLENLTECEALPDEDLDVLGELLSNLHGALEVSEAMQNGASEKDALNGFMQRVMGSIDRG